jgi:hypothetical protein
MDIPGRLPNRSLQCDGLGGLNQMAGTAAGALVGTMVGFVIGLQIPRYEWQAEDAPWQLGRLGGCRWVHRCASE